MAKPIKPGTDNQKPGTYVEVGPRGGNVTHPQIVHIDPVIDFLQRKSLAVVGRKSELWFYQLSEGNPLAQSFI